MEVIRRKSVGIPLMAIIFLYLVCMGMMNPVSAQNEFEATGAVVTSSIDLTRGNGTTPADKIDMTNNADSITISGTGATSPFVVGGEIIIRAPEGMMFVNNNLAGGNFVAATAADFAALTTTSAGFTVGGYTLITEQYTNANGQLVNAVVGAKTAVTGTAGATDTFTIDFEQPGGNDLTVVPIPALGATPMNDKDKPFTVTVNGGTSEELTAEVGKVDVLKAPRLIKALIVGTGAVDLYFDCDIDLTTVNQGVALSLAAGGGGSDFDYNGGGTADVSVDANDKTKVMLRNMTNLPASDGTSTINIDTGNDFIRNDLGPWPVGNSNAQNRAVPIVPDGVAISSVTLDKEVVGCNNNGGGSYNANLKADNTNKLTITFQASGGVPFDFRIRNKDTHQVLAVDAINAVGTNVNGYEIDNVTGLVVAPGTNVVTVTAAANTSGLVQLNVDFDSLNQVGLGAGSEGTLEVQASMDKFATTVSAEVKLDRKAPSLVLSGDNKAKALDRTHVQFQFSEEMDRTACERLFVDNGAGGGTANDGVRNGNEPAIYQVRNMATGTLIPVKGVALDEDNRTVTLTTDLIPVGINLRIEVLGTTAGGPDATNRQGAMDKAGNYISTTNDAYVNSNTFQAAGEEISSVSATNEATRRDVIADGGILRTEVQGPENMGAVWIRAVDADDTTHILSTQPAVQATEVSPGLYRNTTMQLTTGITAEAVIVQASTDQTFSTGVVDSNRVTIDNTRPVVESAAYVDENHCTVTFSEPVLVAGAENGANYTIPGLQVSNTAQLDLSTEKTVTLTTTTMTEGTTYVVDVGAGVQDLAGNAINSSADTIGIDRASFTAGVEPLTVSQQNVSLYVGGTATVTVSGGVPPYTVTASGTANAELGADGVTVTITGVSEGGATVEVRDSASPASVATITVTVAAGQPVPTGQNINELTGSNIASACFTCGSVATGGDTMELAANFPAYEAGVDEYVVLYIPNLGYFFVDDSGALTTDAVAYRVNVTDAVQETIIDEFDVCPALTGVSGTWYVYTLVVPTNNGDLNAIDWDSGDYDLEWYKFDVSCE